MKTTALIILLVISIKGFSQDTINKMNPYIEIKRGVICQTVGACVVAGNAIFRLERKPKDETERILYAGIYGVGTAAFLVGTIYVIQGLNYMYKPTSMGKWSMKVNPAEVKFAFTF
jgi:hypothetical protein